MISLIKFLIVFPFILQFILKFFLSKKNYYIVMNIVYALSLIVMLRTLAGNIGILILLVFYGIILLRSRMKTKKKYKRVHITYLIPVFNKTAVKYSFFAWFILVFIGTLKILISTI